MFRVNCWQKYRAVISLLSEQAVSNNNKVYYFLELQKILIKDYQRHFFEVHPDQKYNNHQNSEYRNPLSQHQQKFGGSLQLTVNKGIVCVYIHPWEIYVHDSVGPLVRSVGYY